MAFKTQLAKEQWSSDIALFQDKIKMREMIDADSRTFLEEISKIDINSALEIAEAEMKQANIEAQMEALGNIASSAVQYGASSGWFSPTESTSTTALGMIDNSDDIFTSNKNLSEKSILEDEDLFIKSLNSGN